MIVIKLIYVSFLMQTIYFSKCFINARDLTYADVLFRVNMWTKKIQSQLRELSTTITIRNKIHEAYDKATDVIDEDGTKIVKDIAEDIRKMMDKKQDSAKRIAEKAEVLAYEAIGEDYYEFYDNPETCQGGQEYDIWLGEIKSKLKYDEHFRTEVDRDHSVVKVVTNIYNNDCDVLKGALWSKGLDETFVNNMKRDPTLTWQYFASPEGFMTHYPGVLWSQERYTATYDFRMRSWYSEALTSPKDIIILLDRSGSMTGIRRKLAAHTVNNILDTLNDNDFVNIYTFTNTTEPLVDCFNDTLVQANEENLRLLRESLPTFKIELAANITIGLIKAFDIFKKGKRAGCNQAIMLITEGIDYDYQKATVFTKYNKNKSVRIFTYLIGNEHADAVEMGWIACNNRGYYVNITLLEAAREKILKYLNVMSRPINMNREEIKSGQKEYVPIWSYLYVDLADRRQTNWLWKKLEGIRQREVFLDFAKRQMMRENLIFNEGITKHMLLMESHPYEEYEKLIPEPFDYMTTVSVPVFNRSANSTQLLGVAGVDVPILHIKSFIPYHRLGVNAYAFIVTNNGYILMHPDLRTEFQNILKPTFNRVDMTEVEILDDIDPKPRLFNKSVVALRELMIEQQSGSDTLRVIDHMDKMRRILKYTRRYYFESISPFSLAIALPDNYGFNIIKFKHNEPRGFDVLDKLGNWSVHPDWNYCKKSVYPGAKNSPNCDPHLTSNLTADAHLIRMFNYDTEGHAELSKRFMIHSVFLATHSGLTRWHSKYNFTNIKSIDETWYKRAVDEYVNQKDTFIYSVPFEIIGYENNTLVTVSGAVFKESGPIITPVAVVGYKFNQRALYNLFKNITMNPLNNDSYMCGTAYLVCFILDDNGYVVLSDEEEYAGNLYTGNFIGDIRPDIMDMLVHNRVYTATRMFDYQGICYYDPKEEKSTASKIVSILHNFFKALVSITFVVWYYAKSVIAGERYQSIKESTLAWERLAINKTVPTPCDKEMWLYTFGTNVNAEQNVSSYGECSWAYAVKRINNSNLLLLVINGLCPGRTKHSNYRGPNPTEIKYNVSLPCYIATKNSYKRKSYMKCFAEADAVRKES